MTVMESGARIQTRRALSQNKATEPSGRIAVNKSKKLSNPFQVIPFPALFNPPLQKSNQKMYIYDISKSSRFMLTTLFKQNELNRFPAILIFIQNFNIEYDQQSNELDLLMGSNRVISTDFISYHKKQFRHFLYISSVTDAQGQVVTPETVHANFPKKESSYKT